MTDARFKTMLAGESGVGKTEFVRVALAEPPIKGARSRILDQTSTIGVDFHVVTRSHTLSTGTYGARHQIWDTAGQERFRSCVESYFRSADIVIFVYDVTSASSFDALEKYWFPLVSGVAPERCLYFIVGTKCDMLVDYGGELQRAVPPRIVDEFTIRIGAVAYDSDSKSEGGRRAYDTFDAVSLYACQHAPPRHEEPVFTIATIKPKKKRCLLQ